jgi:VWFA-related protein
VELAPRTRATETVWAAEVPPDVVTNQAGDQDGRLVIILMDRTIPVQQPTLVARKIAVAAVEALGPHDLAAVVSTKNGAVQNSSIQNLTADRTRLLRAINAGDPSTGISVEAEEIPTMGKLDPRNDGQCLCGVCVLETITRVADAVQSAARRRKTLFFIGSSVIWQSAQGVGDVGCDTVLKNARTAMFAAVDRANLTVHSIDPRGLVNVGPQTRATAMGAQKGDDYAGPRNRLQVQRQDTNDLIASQGALRVLPDRTGGRTVVGRNNPEETVPEIFRESDAYYLLGVERGASSRPDSPRSIEVKVGRKGLKVYAQRQYVLPPARKDASAVATVRVPTPEEALNRLLPSADLPLALAVMPFASPESVRPIVRVNVDVGAFAREDGTGVPLQIAVLAVDRTGQPLASARQTSTIAGVRARSGLPADVNVQSQLELGAGDYAVRVAVSDPATGKVASVFSDVTVPKFESAALSLSGVAVDAASAASVAPSTTTRRVFHRNERVRALLQIYQGTERTDAIAPVSMRVQILDAKGGAVRDQSLPFAEQAFIKRRADCVITLPVAALPPGEYLLKLEASMDRQTSGRALRFVVE